jgi:hypothetical protein
MVGEGGLSEQIPQKPIFQQVGQQQFRPVAEAIKQEQAQKEYEAKVREQEKQAPQEKPLEIAPGTSPENLPIDYARTRGEYIRWGVKYMGGRSYADLPDSIPGYTERLQDPNPPELAQYTQQWVSQTEAQVKAERAAARSSFGGTFMTPELQQMAAASPGEDVTRLLPKDLQVKTIAERTGQTTEQIGLKLGMLESPTAQWASEAEFGAKLAQYGVPGVTYRPQILTSTAEERLAEKERLEKPIIYEERKELQKLSPQVSIFDKDRPEIKPVSKVEKFGIEKYATYPLFRGITKYTEQYRKAVKESPLLEDISKIPGIGATPLFGLKQPFVREVVKGVAQTPAGALEIGAIVPLVGEFIYKEPSTVTTAIVSGAPIMAKGLVEGAKESPGQFIGEQIGFAALGVGASRIPKPELKYSLGFKKPIGVLVEGKEVPVYQRPIVGVEPRPISPQVADIRTTMEPIRAELYPSRDIGAPKITSARAEAQIKKLTGEVPKAEPIQEKAKVSAEGFLERVSGRDISRLVRQQKILEEPRVVKAPDVLVGKTRTKMVEYKTPEIFGGERLEFSYTVPEKVAPTYVQVPKELVPEFMKSVRGEVKYIKTPEGTYMVVKGAKPILVEPKSLISGKIETPSLFERIKTKIPRIERKERLRPAEFVEEKIPERPLLPERTADITVEKERPSPISPMDVAQRRTIFGEEIKGKTIFEGAKRVEGVPERPLLEKARPQELVFTKEAPPKPLKIIEEPIEKYKFEPTLKQEPTYAKIPTEFEPQKLEPKIKVSTVKKPKLKVIEREVPTMKTLFTEEELGLSKISREGVKQDIFGRSEEYKRPTLKEEPSIERKLLERKEEVPKPSRRPFFAPTYRVSKEVYPKTRVVQKEFLKTEAEPVDYVVTKPKVSVKPEFKTRPEPKFELGLEPKREISTIVRPTKIPPPIEPPTTFRQPKPKEEPSKDRKKQEKLEYKGKKIVHKLEDPTEKLFGFGTAKQKKGKEKEFWSM